MFFYSDDPLRDFDRWDAEQQERLKELPDCADCGEKIYDDHYYMINDEPICPDCLDSNYRREADDQW